MAEPVTLFDLVSDMFIGAMLETAKTEARAIVNVANGIELTGSRAVKLRKKFVAAMRERRENRKPFLCEHLTISRPGIGRAARPGFIRCPACSDTDIYAHGESDRRSITTCDGCGATVTRIHDVVVLFGYVIIFAAACIDCITSDIAENLEAAT